MEHNLETLRTRLTQVADLRDAQGIREDHRALVTRLTEVEECASVHALREFMSKILRLESMKRSGCPLLGLTIAMPIPKINLAWKIDHLEGVGSEVRHHSADFRGQCLDHHHQHKNLMSQPHLLLRCFNRL